MSSRVLLAGFVLVASGWSRAADCNRNGVEDAKDISAGSAQDCNLNGIPDDCDIAPVNHGLAPRGKLAVEKGAGAMVSGDLDGDGRLDIAVANSRSSNVSLLWNTGGDFLPAVIVGVGLFPRALAAGTWMAMLASTSWQAMKFF